MAFEALKIAFVTLELCSLDDLLSYHGWTPFIHCLVVTDGFMDYEDLAKPVFHPSAYWNTTSMTEIFRMEILTILHKKKIITDDIATNLASWKNSGFNVHTSDSFLPHIGNTLKNRLAYAFRPPACLSRIQFHETSVSYKTKKGIILNFTPMEFLSKLTLHIPDHYQNVRIYLGFYSSHVRRLIKKTNPLNQAITSSEAKPVTSSWANYISRIFKSLPINCPNCRVQMKFDGFILHVELFKNHFPEISRAPPLKGFAMKTTESLSVDYSFFD